MPLPSVTELDPEVEAEGGIDPLGLAAIADRLAEDMVPGITSRMSRLRLVTLVTLGSRITEGMPERGKDGTPAYVVFEWLALQAFAGVEDQAGLLRVQGMFKARTARRDGAPMSPRRYLKSPAAFGVHAAYKKLGRALHLLDDDLRWRTGGDRLLSIWEKEQGIDGFLSGSSSTTGGKLREKLRSLILAGLEEGYAECPKATVLDLFQKNLHPGRIGRLEGEHLRGLLVDPSGGTRGELLSLLEREDVRSARQDAFEAPFLRFVQTLASSELRSRLKAIDAFENVARPLTEAFGWARHLSTKKPGKAITSREFAEAAPELAGRLRSHLQEACEAVRGTSSFADVEALARDFESVVDGSALFMAVLKRHEQTQRRKPPQGKRPWIERTSDGGGVVRGLYKLSEPPSDEDRHVHFYRTASMASFLDDLRVSA